MDNQKNKTTKQKAKKEATNKKVTKVEKEIKPVKKHNGIISFWKFLFCLMIVIYHANVFSSDKNNVLFSKGSIGVEFFFLVSGYLLTKSALKKTDDDKSNLGTDTLKYIWKKYKTFLPYTITAGLFALTIIRVYKLNNNISYNISAIWDMLLLRMTGINGLSVNGPVWYLSSMLLCMLILYPIIKKFKTDFLKLVAPVILLVGFGLFSHKFSNLRTPDYWAGFTYKGNIRAFLELLLGGELYLISEKIKTINFTKFGKKLITLIEIECFILPFTVSQFISGATSYDFIMLVVISIGIVLAFSEKTLEYNLFCNKFFYWLEKLSLTLYIFHFSVRLFFRHFYFFKDMPYLKRLAYYLPTTLIVSIIIMYVMDFLKKKHFFLDKVKYLIINKKEID